MSYAFQANMPVVVDQTTFETIISAASVEHAVWLRLLNVSTSDPATIIIAKYNGTDTVEVTEEILQPRQRMLLGPFNITNSGATWQIRGKVGASGQVVNVTPEAVTGP